ncbi:hypothetical protein HY642_01720 [Candidatus Woesearchaeota archaeon]|nr:hypothetical protein [Candidatus Woesearchaeota archaeon]
MPKTPEVLEQEEREYEAARERENANYKAALHKVLNARQYQSLRERFRFAYEYRKRFPWLNESQERGLAYAIRCAFSNYCYPPKGKPARQERTAVSAAFEKKLREYEEGTHQGTDSVFHCVLRFKSIDLAKLSVAELASHMAKALESYCQSYQRGTRVARGTGSSHMSYSHGGWVMVEKLARQLKEQGHFVAGPYIVPKREAKTPEEAYFGVHDSFGVYFAHVGGVTLQLKGTGSEYELTAVTDPRDNGSLEGLLWNYPDRDWLLDLLKIYEKPK